SQQTPEQACVGIPLSQLELKGNSTIDVVDETVPILHQGHFTKYLSEVTHQRTFVLTVEGITTAYLGKLKAKLKLDKKLELNGMRSDRAHLPCPIRLSHRAVGLNMFRGFNIESARVILPFQEDGTNLKVIVRPARSASVVPQAHERVLGKCDLRPILWIDIKSAIANLVPILEGQKKALSEGNLELTANGNSTIYNEKHITYSEDVLNNITLKASLSIIKVLTETLRGLTAGGKGLGGDLLKGDGFSDIMGVLREALKGDRQKNIVNGLGTALKEVVGGKGASFNNSLGGSNFTDAFGGLEIKDVVGGLKYWI
ncbi:hypothetical protein ACJ73_03013, partial [Blastomyces percursus]